MQTFTKETLHEEDIVVYLKNERTGSSTIRKCKFIGQVIGFDRTRVKIRQLSKSDQFVTPEEIQDYGEVLVYPREIVHIIISKHQEKDVDLNNIIENKNKDIYQLLGNWFCALEDEGVNPWACEECMDIANRNDFTEEDYNEFLSKVIQKLYFKV